MINYKKIFYLISLAGVSLTSIAMENPAASTSQVSKTQVSEATTRAILSRQENISKELQKDIETSNFVFFDAYVFTNKQIAQALKKAKDSGATIEGTIGTHGCNKDMEEFFLENDIEVQKIPQNHLKVFGTSEKNPDFGSPGKSTLHVGSANPTYNAYRNMEVVMQTKNDKQFYMEHYKRHKNMMQNEEIDSLEKKILEETPKKVNKCIGSDENSLTGSKIARVHTLIKSTNEKRILYITSMNWNSLEMTEALINAHLDGITIYLILNHSALEGKGKEQLAQMHEIGIPMYIYYPGEHNRTIQHSKVFLRIDGSEYLVINSTANMTPEGDKENNADSYYTREQESEKIGKEIQVALDNLIASDSCKPYDEAVTTLAEREKAKKSQTTKKRLFSDDTDTNTLKKK